MATRWGDREVRRRDILGAARTLVHEKGLAALQMREVADRARVALGTVYTYFATKEALFAALYAERLDQMLDELEPKLASITDLEDLFVAFATSYRDVYAEFGKELDIFAIISRSSGLDSAIWNQLLASTSRLMSAVRLIIERVSAQMDDPPAEPDLILALLWTSVTGLAEHFTGVRHQMHRHIWEDTVRFTAHTLISGLVPDRQRHGN